MNEEITKAMDALAGGGSGGGDAGGEAVDWKARYEEMAHKYQTSQVEQGRVKKLTEENNALKKQLEELNTSTQIQDAINDLPEEMRNDVPEEILKSQTFLAKRAAERAFAAQAAELQAVKDQMAGRSRDQFAARIEQEFPGFLREAVTEGGDKHKAWVAYQRFNAASINAATNARDFDTLAWHIRTFYANELGVTPPSGGTGAAAPDPSAIGGGQPAAARPGKTYTWDEIDKLYDEIERLRACGDRDGMKRLSDEVERAQREGRVK